MNLESKIICVGNSKTGTTSLLRAFEYLGYPSVGWCRNLIAPSDNESNILIESKKYKFLKDWPWVFHYKILDRQYINSKFILTVRDEDSWVKSFISFMSINRDQYTTNARILYYGFDPYIYKDNPEFLIENIYRKRNYEILNYFKDRMDDLLILDIFNSKNPWLELCPFIGENVPNIPFPIENVGKY